MLFPTYFPKVRGRERRVWSAISCSVLQGEHPAVVLLVVAASYCSCSPQLNVLKHSSLQRDAQPLAGGTYDSVSSFVSLSLVL